MIELPELFERHMTLGKQAVKDGNLEEARSHFEDAYGLKDDMEANVCLVNVLVALKEYQEAYDILKEKKRVYLEEPSYQGIYFQVLLHLKLFLDIEKLFVSYQGEDYETLKKDYTLVRDYQLLTNKEFYNEIVTSLKTLERGPVGRERVLLNKLNYLPKEEAVDVIKELLLREDVSIFIRSGLLQHLVQLELSEPVMILTIKGEKKEVIPKELPLMKELYQDNQVVSGLRAYFEQNNPSLIEEIEKMLKLYLGCLYPFSNDLMKPEEEWLNLYKLKYGNLNNADISKEVLWLQEKLDKEVSSLLSNG